MGLTQKLGTIPLAIFTDASNNIGIGGSPSGSYKFEVTGNIRGTGTAYDLYTSSGIGSSAASGLLRVVTAGTSTGIAIGQANSSRYTAILPNEHIIYNDDFFMRTNGAFPLSLGTNNTIRLSILSSGGLVTYGSTMNIRGTATYMWFTESGVADKFLIGSQAGSSDLVFRSGSYDFSTGTERMRIGSDGKVTITSGNGQPLVLTSSTNNQYLLINSSGGGESMTQYYNPTASNWFIGIRTANGLSSTSGFHIYSDAGGGDRLGIFTNGNYAFAGSNVSDRRLKENIKTIEINAIDTIMQLVPKTYIMTSNPDVKRAGFIAQEVQEILPDLINGVEAEDEFLGLDYNGLLAYSIKAIQELSAKVSALENKS